MIGGYIGALIPGEKSNIPPLLLAVIVGSLVSKVVYGDFDKGYVWTTSDILYWIITILEALIGGCLALYFKNKNK
jgi:uncharacterized membrane protein YeaQ/YmgE (transglycosylase-associated protein family)